jgi:RNA polymerase sigma-70 factor (ECF subfamily)
VTSRQATSGTLLCLVEPGLDNAVLATLESHFSGVADVRVARSARRRERRSELRRMRSVDPPLSEERRQVLNPNGRRVDDRRRSLAPAPSLPLPRRVLALEDRIRFSAPAAGEDRRLAVADSLRLVVRFQLGDAEGFRALYERHFDGVYRYLLTALHDRHDAEDGAQEVFIRALRGLPRYEFRGSPFEAWLFRIVRNHTLNVRRRAAPESPADPAHIDLWRDQRDLRGLMEGPVADPNLLLSVERLPASQRQVLALRYMIGLEWADIAAVMDRSSGAVRQLEQRALSYLRKRLDAVEGEPTSRTHSMPMRRRACVSPVALRRRRALLDGARAA